ncbi:mucin-2-like isoform X2 [Sitodiplosis mosellana]|uniref:mucin-2-like isoform X2 n=1 Tax=Sitodiplosis mosellana TaxID=263140 RepID=UPI0024447B15|nr:mucin-2-like isoform X2 [Sitodiplosis mosellana]
MSLATILAIWVALTAHFSVLSNAAHLPSNALALRNSENRIKIELIDVKCDKNENGMHVTIQFSQPFEGIIYSQGYFNDPKCRYVSAGEGDQSYNFVVPFEGCGSKPSCAICDSVDNILVIQQDEEVQGEFDAARKISCSRTGVEEEKKVYFKPFIVQNLDVITVPTKHGGVDCWMDIQRGIYPKLTPIGEVIKIGEELTVLVYLRDPKKEYDLTVRNCWAYDSEDFDDKKTGKVQLSDSSGCTIKRKLFGSWHKTDETGSSDATLQLYNTLRAFKFPDESQIYLKCDIEICRGNCVEAICDADDINKVDINGADINKVDCTLDPLHEKCIRNKFIERGGFTTIANQPHQSASTSKVTARVPFNDNSRRPSFIYTTTQRANYVSTTLPDEFTTTLKPLVCTPNSQDIRCIQQQYAENTVGAETTTLRETATYQNLLKTTTLKPGYDSFCSLYPKHKRCNQRVTDDFGSNLEILTFKPPSPFATVKYQPTTEIPSRNLKYASTTETTAITEQPLNCNGLYLDPRCPNPKYTGSPPTYLPPSPTKQVVVPTFAPRCYPGSLDPRCPKIDISTSPAVKPTTTPPITTTPKKFVICVPDAADDINCDDESSKVTEEPPAEKITTPPRNQLGTTKQPEKPVCYFGSTNPECQKVSTQIITFKPRPTTTSIPPTTTTTTTTKPFISTTRAPICYPGSLDSRCVQPTKSVYVSFGTESGLSTEPTIPSTPAVPSTTRAPICYPGSIDPRCPKQTTTKKIIPEIVTTRKVATELPKTTPYIPTTTGTPICYLGSQDPRCRQSTTKRVFVSFGTESDLSTRPQISSTPIVPSTTRAPICYPGSLDPRCVQATTKKVPESFGTTRPPVSFPPTIPSTTRAPICYPGSPDPRCPKVITTKKIIPEIITTQKVITETRGPVCYTGALDPRCQKPTTEKQFIPSISTTQEVSSEKPTASTPRCYPGSLDPRCIQSTTKGVLVSFGTESGLSTRPPLSTPVIPSTTRAPFCYPGSPDPRCRQFTTENPIIQTTKPTPTFNLISTTTIKPQFSTTQTPARCYPGSLDPRCSSKQLVVPLQCGPGSLDPRCPNPTPTAEPATYLPPKPTSTYNTQRPPLTTTTVQPFICTSNSLDPRCRLDTTLKFIPSVTTEGTITTVSPETITRFVPSVTTTTLTQGPTYTTTTRPPFSFPTFTTRPPTRISTTIPPLICTPNSLDPRCRIDTTTKAIQTDITSSTTTPAPETTAKVVPTTTQRPTYTTTTRSPFTFPTFSTRRIISSPQPFTTRPTTKPTSTTTESVLCYPGSTIEGCKNTFTTPAYCFPGSKDPRCPQLPPSFSTRQPSTYLPPFPDVRLNRVRRQTSVENEPTHEIVKFSLSFKPFNFS